MQVLKIQTKWNYINCYHLIYINWVQFQKETFLREFDFADLTNFSKDHADYISRVVNLRTLCVDYITQIQIIKNTKNLKVCYITSFSLLNKIFYMFCCFILMVWVNKTHIKSKTSLLSTFSPPYATFRYFSWFFMLLKWCEILCWLSFARKTKIHEISKKSSGRKIIHWSYNFSVHLMQKNWKAFRGS